jgi:hypothetical protein
MREKDTGPDPPSPNRAAGTGTERVGVTGALSRSASPRIARARVIQFTAASSGFDHDRDLGLSCGLSRRRATRRGTIWIGDGCTVGSVARAASPIGRAPTGRLSQRPRNGPPPPVVVRQRVRARRKARRGPGLAGWQAGRDSGLSETRVLKRRALSTRPTGH